MTKDQKPGNQPAGPGQTTPPAETADHTKALMDLLRKHAPAPGATQPNAPAPSGKGSPH